VDVSSSDTDEALELLTLKLGRDYSPRLGLNNAHEASSESSTASEWFEDWTEVKDMAAIVYVALTAEPSTSRPDCGATSR
jgi:hypothetical protein